MPDTTDIDGTLFEQLRPRLTAISQRIVGSRAEAEDIVQDSFFKWRGADQACLATPAAWLTTVVQHQSIDHLRKRARESAAVQRAAALLPQPLPDPLLQHAELGDALARMFACLSPPERLALVMHEVFECSHADIAAALATSNASARQYLARGRRKLRDADDTMPAAEKLCRELIRRFQAAINGMDVPALVTLLGAEQPMSVLSAPPRSHRASANDAIFSLVLAA